MSDTSINRIIQYGTAAERGAFTPDPPTIGAGVAQTLYLWMDTDNLPTIELYVWDPDGMAWEPIPVGGAVSVAAAGALDGDGTGGDPLSVIVDGVTIQINGSNELEVIGGATVMPAINQYRLSATTAVPVTTSDVTTTSTLYWVPYKGLHCSVYDGAAAWVDYTGGELSIALSSLTADRPYDVFLDYNGGTEQLVLLAWTSDTVRATALTLQDGILVLTGATDHRYLGTIRTIATNATCDFGGTAARVGGRRFIWNYYNRVLRPLSVFDDTNTWDYSTATWRQANAALPTTGNKVEFVIGVAEDAAVATVQCMGAGSAATTGGYTGIGYNSITAPIKFMSGASGDSQAMRNVTERLIPAIGYSYFAWLEAGNGVTTMTWYGDANSTVILSGLNAEVWG